MPSPSNADIDSSSPDASATATSSGKTTELSLPSNVELDPSSSRADIPSTSAQPSIRSSPSIECDPNNPSSETSSSGQPRIPPHLSSIEHDPNNPPPETPSDAQNEPETEKREFTFYERLTIQIPVWKQHFFDFRKQIWVATIISLIAVLCCILAYVTQRKDIFLGITSAMSAICFTFIWTVIDEGPPFRSDKKGNPIKPLYLRPVTLSQSAGILLSDSQKLLRDEQVYQTMMEQMG